MTGLLCSFIYIILFFFEISGHVTNKMANYEILTTSQYAMRLIADLFLLWCGTMFLVVVADLIAERKSLVNIGTFFTGLTHELRNPLAIIKNETALMKRDYKKQHLTVIDEQSERILALVNDVLSYGGEKHPKLRQLDLRGVVDTAFNFVLKGLPSDKADQIQVDKEYYSEKIKIHGDNGQLEQCFINIIMNSIEAIDYQGKINIKVDRINIFWSLVSISDNGGGISNDDLDKIFDPFFSKKKKHNGTGLGLPIVKRIIEDHGGNIDVVSQEGKGTTFLVKLPIF